MRNTRGKYLLVENFPKASFFKPKLWMCQQGHFSLWKSQRSSVHSPNICLIWQTQLNKSRLCFVCIYHSYSLAIDEKEATVRWPVKCMKTPLKRKKCTVWLLMNGLEKEATVRWPVKCMKTPLKRKKWYSLAINEWPWEQQPFGDRQSA